MRMSLSPAQICVNTGGGGESLQHFENRPLSVAEIQALYDVEVSLPVLSDSAPKQGVGIVDLSAVDCRRGLATVTLASGEEVAASFEPRLLPHSDELVHRREGLTVMNGYPEYGAVKDVTPDDALEIIKQKSQLTQASSSTGIPLVNTASLPVVGLMLIALMVHLIAHLRRLTEMARSGHAARMLGFPWMLTMNSRKARITIDTMTVSLVLLVVGFGIHDSIRAAVPCEGAYNNPSWLDMIIMPIVIAVVGWVLVSQIELQRALPLTSNFYASLPARRSYSGLVPVGMDPVVGRDRELLELAKLDRPYIVLTGASGMGKTTLAHEYGRQHRANHPDGVFILDCTDSVPAGLAALGQVALQLPFASDMSLEVRAQVVLHALAMRRCLLIYDGTVGVQDPKTLVDWLPPAGHVCRVLVISRASSWPPLFHRVPLGPLGPAATVQMWNAAGLRVNVPGDLHAQTKGVPGRIAEKIIQRRDVPAKLRGSS